MKHGDSGPFKNSKDMLKTIDDVPLGNVPWQSFTLQYEGERPSGKPPSWMSKKNRVWFRDPREVVRNMLSNPDFDGEFDYGPVQQFDKDGNRVLTNFMSGNWAWKQAVSSFAIDVSNGSMPYSPCNSFDFRT